MKSSQTRKSRRLRPAWIVPLACLAAALAGWLALRGWHSRAAEQSPPAARPRSANVVVFLIDTLRADRLGAYGYPRGTSPNIDALAAEGVLFEQCYAPAPWTLPTVVSLLTSSFPCEHGVLVDGQRIAGWLEPLAVRFKRAGYATASFFSNPYAGPLSGLERGYDVCRPWPAVRGPLLERWLNHIGRRPFFVYIHNMEPHDPYRVPRRYVQMFGDVSRQTRATIRQATLEYRRLTRVDFEAGLPPGTTDNTELQRRALARLDQLKAAYEVLYDASVRLADEFVGGTVDVLKRRGLWEQTLFIVLSDHGEELGEHGGWQHDQSVYEELVRVPLVIHLPRGRFASRRIPGVVTLVDLLPTIFDYLRRPQLMSPARGTSLLPLLRGAGPAPAPDALRITAVRMNRKKYYRPYKQTRGDINVVVRQGAWKGIWNVEPQTLELYDLSVDPAEQDDLAAREAGRAALMRQAARAWLHRCRPQAGDAVPAGLQGIDEASLRRLRALGYASPASRPGR